MSEIDLPQLLPSLLPAKSVPEKLKQLKTKFTLDTEFFSQLVLRLLEKENTRHDFTSFLARRKGPPAGWVDKPERGSRVFTNLGERIISQLIEGVFWASLERDEGRPLRFSVAYRCLTNEDRAGDWDWGNEVLFESPLNFTVKELKKLGPSVGRDASVLVFADDHQKLRIRGISPVSFLPLKISILDPGHLTLSYYDENVAFVSGSEVGFIKFSEFQVNTVAVWRRLYPQQKQTSLPVNDARVQVIIRTLRNMRELGHGGALMVVPKRKKIAAVQSITYETPAGFEQASEQIRQYNEGKDDQLRQVMLDHYAGMIANLTAVDGATIITRDIQLLGFGAKLKNSTQPPTIYLTHPIDHPEGWRKVDLAGLGNLRHQSAARFVASQKDSVAFVVSQDGNISSMVWMEKEGGSEPYLLVDSRLDLTLF